MSREKLQISENNLSTLGSRLRAFRKAKGLTLIEVAEKLDIAHSTLSALENDVSLPSAETLMSLYRNYGISYNWLLEGDGEPLTISEAKSVEYGLPTPPSPELRLITRDEAEKESFHRIERVENYVPIKLLADRVAGGDPREINENDIESYTVIYESWVKPGGVYSSIRIKGDSMAPVLREGDIVTINHTRTDPAELRGKIVAVRIPDEGITIKYLNEMPDVWVLEPENRLAQTIYADKKKSKIIGVVEWAWRRFE